MLIVGTGYVIVLLKTYLVLLPSPAVFMTRPSASTTSKFKTFSLIVPYLTALVPDALVEHIPQSVASAPGSINRNIHI